MTDEPDLFARTAWGPGNPHPLCARLRGFREEQGRHGWSLASVEARYGIPGVVLGGWEAGRRMPSVGTFDDALQQLYRKRLAIVDADEADTPLTVPGVCVELRRIVHALERWPVDAFVESNGG